MDWRAARTGREGRRREGRFVGRRQGEREAIDVDGSDSFSDDRDGNSIYGCGGGCGWGRRRRGGEMCVVALEEDSAWSHWREVRFDCEGGRFGLVALEGEVGVCRERREDGCGRGETQEEDSCWFEKEGGSGSRFISQTVCCERAGATATATATGRNRQRQHPRGGNDNGGFRDGDSNGDGDSRRTRTE